MKKIPLLNIGDIVYRLLPDGNEQGNLCILKLKVVDMLDDEVTIRHKGCRIYRLESYSEKYKMACDFGWRKETTVGRWLFTSKEQAIKAWEESDFPKGEYPEFV